MAKHEQSVGATDEWYTPPYIFEALGCQFDLDVASPGAHVVPWVPATNHIASRSLEDWLWTGFKWMNPPFGKRNGIVPWLDKFCRHGNGVCLIPDRTSAPWWQQFAPKMDLILFVSPKIRFIPGRGQKNTSPAQGTVLGALGDQGVSALRRASSLGVLFRPV